MAEKNSLLEDFFTNIGSGAAEAARPSLRVRQTQPAQPIENDLQKQK